MKLLVLGGTSFDSIIYMKEFPKKGTYFTSHYHETIGSTGTGKALNLHQLGLNVLFHSVIGKDVYGEQIKTTFEKRKLPFIFDLDEKTERHTNIMNEQGERISLYTVYSNNDIQLDLMPLEEEIKTSDLIVLNILAYNKQLIPILRKYNKLVLTDLHDYDGLNPYHKEFIDISDIIFCSSEKLKDYDGFMKQMIKQNKRLVVCTHGKNGASAVNHYGEYVHEDIIPSFEVKDTNGAGDSFFSGFLYAMLQNKNLSVCLRYGSICAGLCVSSYELVNEALNEPYLNELYHTYYQEEIK